MPLLLLWPCLALTVTILAMNGLCDGLRDVLDPHPVVLRASWFSWFRQRWSRPGRGRHWTFAA